MKKVIQVAIEYNIGKSTLIGELQKHFPENIYTINTLLSDEEIAIVENIFPPLKKSNPKSSKIENNININFSFTNDEQNVHKRIIAFYSILKNQIELIDKKEKQYWALNQDELYVLKQQKLNRILEIQDEFNKMRQEIFETKEKNKNTRIRESDIDDEILIMQALRDGEGDRFGF